MKINKTKTLARLKELKQYEYNYNYCSQSLNEELAKLNEMMEVVESSISDAEIESIVNRYGYRSNTLPIYE